MPLTYEQALSWVDRLYEKLGDRRAEVDKFDAYYRGKHPLAMASDVWRKQHELRYANFSDNWCGVVADATAQRTRVTGLSIDDDSTMSDAERVLWGDWQRNDGDMQSAQGFLEAGKSRRSFALVWGDENGEPTLTWEDPSQVVVAHDPERVGKRLAALKTWCDDDNEYATLYVDDGLYKFVRQTRFETKLQLPDHVRRDLEQGGWTIRDVPNEPWPLPHSLGEVPVVEFRNRGPLRGEPLSEIGGVAAMQDAINLLWAYLFAAADYASLPARVVLGMDAPTVPKLADDGTVTQQRIPIPVDKLIESRLLYLNQPGADPKIAQWDAAKLDVFTDVVEIAVGHIAAQTRTPQHYLILGRNANPPSADALKAAEAGLVAKVHEQQLFLGAGVRSVFSLFAKVRGDDALARLARQGRVAWEDAENRSEAQKADAAQKWRASGVPLEALVERYWSSDPNEVSRIMDMAEAEAEDPTMAQIMREFRSAEPGVTADAAAEQ